MKKYFVVETDEAIEFGDVVSLTFFKETENGKVTIEKDVEFNENSMGLLIETGFIEERETEEEEDVNNDLLDFGDEIPCEALEALEEDFEALEDKVDKLEEQTSNLITMHNDFVKLMTDMLDTFKEFVLSMPDKEEKKNGQPKKK